MQRLGSLRRLRGVTAIEGQVPALGFEEAYREYRLALLRLAYLMSGSHDLSEDVVQSVFTSAHGRWDQIENPLPYLKRAVVNVVKDGQRRRLHLLARTPERPPVALPPEVDETWARIGAAALDPARGRCPPLLRGPPTFRGGSDPRPPSGNGALRPPPRSRQAPEGTRMNDTQNPQTVEQRVRHTLQTVAATVNEDWFATTPRPTVVRRRRRTRRLAVGAAAVAITVAVAASAFVRQGPEYVDTIPKAQIVMTGSVDGSRYLLIESDRTDKCGQPIPGVELVEERKNLLGSEWDTTGYYYGEQTGASCDLVDTSRYLRDPALFNASGARVGDSLVWVYAVHPDVDTVRITSGDYTKDLKVYKVDGAGYAPFPIPKDMDQYTSELVIDGHVVPGSKTVREVSRP